MPAKFQCGSTTWAILLGEQPILAGERLEPPLGATAPCSQRFWVFCPGATIAVHPLSTTRDKSLELQTSATPSFHSSGSRRAACNAFPCCRVITAARDSASTRTDMWLDILRAPLAPELFCGFQRQALKISVLCPGAVTAGPVTLTTRMRLRARPQVPPTTVRSGGQQRAMCAILVLCREI